MAAFIDCTGDADLAALSGAPFSIADAASLQASTLNFILTNVDTEAVKKLVFENHEEFGLFPLLSEEQFFRSDRYIMVGLQGLAERARREDPQSALWGNVCYITLPFDTWDDFREAAKKLTVDSDPLTGAKRYGFATSFTVDSSDPQITCNMLLDKYGTMFNEDRLRAGLLFSAPLRGQRVDPEDRKPFEINIRAPSIIQERIAPPAFSIRSCVQFFRSAIDEMTALNGTTLIRRLVPLSADPSRGVWLV